MDEIPNAHETGAAGTQQAAASNAELMPVQSVLPDEILTATMVGLANEHQNAFGGRLASKMTAGIFQSKQQDLQQCKEELGQTRRLLSVAQAQLGDYKTQVALFEQRQADGIGPQIVQLAVVSAGFAVIGIAIDMYKEPAAKNSHLVLGVGIALVVVGWVWTLIEQFRKKKGH